MILTIERNVQKKESKTMIKAEDQKRRETKPKLRWNPMESREDERSTNLLDSFEKSKWETKKEDKQFIFQKLGTAKVHDCHTTNVLLYKGKN